LGREEVKAREQGGNGANVCQEICCRRHSRKRSAGRMHIMVHARSEKPRPNRWDNTSAGKRTRKREELKSYFWGRTQEGGGKEYRRNGKETAISLRSFATRKRRGGKVARRKQNKRNLATSSWRRRDGPKSQARCSGGGVGVRSAHLIMVRPGPHLSQTKREGGWGKGRSRTRGQGKMAKRT